MFLSQVFEIALSICRDQIWQVTELCNFIAWSFETGNCIFVYRNGQWSMCFYGFCDLEDAKKIADENDFVGYIKVLLRKQTRGEVIMPYLVIGEIDMIYKNLFKNHVKQLKSGYILYHKTKTNKMYLMEVI